MTASTHHTALRSSFQPQTRSFIGNIRRMIALAHQRRQLPALDDHLLADIGISRAQALEEGRQTIWNAPSHWHG